MTPEAIIQNRSFQETLDNIRIHEGYDFAAIAFYESKKPSAPIKWHYVSGNQNNRFKLIILRKGHGLAGTVMKTGKRMVIANVGWALSPEEKIDYPILLSENLTAVFALPLWYNNQVYGVLLFGQRDGNPLPKIIDHYDIQHKFGIFNEE
ncbi:nitrate respiration regulation accessory nitrate sensor NreA [Staphylococcus simiae]|uniref:nitrate respiration regulation accessory nitrate sensor NreA n=1 Tax=Staphylococcus simiae TaxID=308354 RepID=UPI001A978727|nr:nitrate respiration regulation accessory nitrate sensor NreA [Staphylococcus simiae]MBO1199662.1 nitrate respiration regulation accessory nitrate sensor NreA [Staphylococcus simiae]MBO1202015.1 nitrate respiration regulation accessory nitrate sensor NreA [Staphylococcus simiae]MBO1204230.1 nitrate respiration regulation accessory nitrate sensor NreA [Staphylococcus simiae]MBO1211684.1 nitrate respiration regulation accessory nitrate sensor NreA [Staphylococcus simiae]MBO1230454.1 nitrate re